VSDNFWIQLEQLMRAHAVIIDRPRGTRHPRYPDFHYPYDYGHLAGTASGDGQGIDVWIGSLSSPSIIGVVCTVDLSRHDAEIKLLVGCTVDDARVILSLHNQGDQAGILVLRK
jgi:inorganic pyrophosphatase